MYLRVENASGVASHLLASKTKVAPVKTLTIPRLELSAADLLSELLPWVSRSWKLDHCEMFAWSDSSVTLDWISGLPSRWKGFVANRVSRIQTRCPDVTRYVPTKDNPADLASRGISVSTLTDNPLWWHGPSWLTSSSMEWPVSSGQVPASVDREERLLVSHVAAESFDISERCSDWPKLIRATSVFIRYIEILKNRIYHQPVKNLTVSSSEVVLHCRSQARIFWVRQLQTHCFPSELLKLRQGVDLPRGNRLISLSPYLDPDGIIRVGGRLANAIASDEAKHPAILGNHRITRLIIRNAHLRTLHGGTSLVMRTLFESYWVLRAKLMIKSELSRCVTCARYRTTMASQRMAALPEVRVTRCRSFQRVGVDYAGPVLVSLSRSRLVLGRGQHSRKAYIAVFVCFVTRAIHLELVREYLTRAFLASFKRFCARRGTPTIMLSDNGPNFKGAARELRRLLNASVEDPDFTPHPANEGITWRFIPPGAPHFGGIWESGVKSVKFHLRRVSGNHKLNIEEYWTLLCQVEACLNSRPIAGFSSDPDDLSYLTPGHFLIGVPLVSPPEPYIEDGSTGLLTRWRLVQSLHERFWKIWSRDYLRTLQKRNKWRNP